ncbi:MAG: hypothetical protein QNJ22_15770 [Desulfosarcinaceae bacterium]|nr:hypothetical protein [Desulfosarcinaceae bacterium]
MRHPNRGSIAQPSNDDGERRPPRAPQKLTRREFVHYSTFALLAAGFSAPLAGCGGGGGGGDGGNEWADAAPDPGLSLDPTEVTPGRLLEIGCSEAPATGVLPEDIYSVVVEVDGAVAYGLRPLYFAHHRIAVPTPPMVEDLGGTYFDARNVRVRLAVSGRERGHAFLTVTQDGAAPGNGADLLALLDETQAELAALDADRVNLFADEALLDLWNKMITPTATGTAALETLLDTLYSDRVAEVVVIDGSTYPLLPEDMNLAERLLDHLQRQLPSGLQNPFLDAFPTSGSRVIKGLTALLGYALPGAFLVMTRDREERSACSAAVAALATALVPAACMCVTGNCMRLLTTQQAEPDWIAKGVNWYANLLLNQGHYALNERLICATSDSHEALRRLVTQDSVDLLETLSAGLWEESEWSNSTPWSNGAPWSNSAPWSNTLWTNQPWSHIPWNNTAPWDNNIWNNNVWNNATPWSNDAWNNTTPWSDNAWSNTPWSNTPWGNTPWSNTPWSNTPWSNNPWSNTPWNNFVNSGS